MTVNGEERFTTSEVLKAIDITPEQIGFFRNKYNLGLTIRETMFTLDEIAFMHMRIGKVGRPKKDD